VYIYQPGKWAVKYMRVRVNLCFVRFFDVFFLNVLTLGYILFFQFLITPLLTANVYFSHFLSVLVRTEVYEHDRSSCISK